MILSPELVEASIKNGFSHATCSIIHADSCNKFCFDYFFTTWQATYKTYGFVYILQLLFKLKTASKNPSNLPKQIFHLFIAYLKSTSLTAVQMMIMRRILCLLCKYHRNTSKNLIAANALSGLYLAIESPGRQYEISLYATNKSVEILYNMLIRRKPYLKIKNGQCILFACSIAILCYNYFNNKELIRKNYFKFIMDSMLNQI